MSGKLVFFWTSDIFSLFAILMNFKGSSNTNEWREEEVKAGQGCQERSEGYVSQVDSFQRVSDLWAGAGCLVKPLKHHIKCWNWYLTAKIAKRGRVTQMLARKSLFWGKANAWYYFKPGMSEDSIFQIGKEVDWWAADLAASYCSDLLRF